MFDSLDLLKPRSEAVYTGSYRKTPEDAPSYFEYSIVNYQSKTYSAIINNIISTKEGEVIKTIWDCDWTIGSFVYTQEGKQYVISDIQKDMKNDEAARIFAENPMSEFIIALLLVENPKGIR